MSRTWKLFCILSNWFVFVLHCICIVFHLYSIQLAWIVIHRVAPARFFSHVTLLCTVGPTSKKVCLAKYNCVTVFSFILQSFTRGRPSCNSLREHLWHLPGCILVCIMLDTSAKWNLIHGNPRKELRLLWDPYHCIFLELCLQNIFTPGTGCHPWQPCCSAQCGAVQPSKDVQSRAQWPPGPRLHTVEKQGADNLPKPHFAWGENWTKQHEMGKERAKGRTWRSFYLQWWVWCW